MNLKYNLAAYVWPAFTGTEKRAYQFWPEGIGEWETIKNLSTNNNGDLIIRKPLWGYVDEADSVEMERQIKVAKEHGISTFIYDWYWFDNRPFLENCLNDGFLKAKNSTNMNFCIMWANHNANNIWDKRLSDIYPPIDIWTGSVSRKQFDVIVNRIVNQYFTKDHYLKIDNKPVFIIYCIKNLIKGLGGIKNTKHAIDYFREVTKKKGFKDLYLLGVVDDTFYSVVSGVDYKINDIEISKVINYLQFDGVTHYQFAHFTNMNRDYLEIIEDAKKEWEIQKKLFSIPYYAHVSVGWDNNPRFNKYIDYSTKNNTPENFKKVLQYAKEFLDKNENQFPLLTINSWNEWTETSYLQPDDVFGYKYLEAIKEVFVK